MIRTRLALIRNASGHVPRRTPKLLDPKALLSTSRAVSNEVPTSTLKDAPSQPQQTPGAKSYTSDSMLKLRSVLLARRQNGTLDSDEQHIKTKPAGLQKVKEKKKDKFVITADSLFAKFKNEFQVAPENEFEKSSTNNFFNEAKVTFMWAVDSFDAIPSEKARLENEIAKLKELEREGPFELSSEIRVNDLGKKPRKEEIADFEDAEPEEDLEMTLEEQQTFAAKQEKEELKQEHSARYHQKKHKIHPELLRDLPEVVFIGKCNVGKLSLLNSLCTSIAKREPDDYAHASKRAGFTQTINCYNVGNKLRIIDTPGYGIRATRKQGEEIMRYLTDRKELRKIYLLVNLNHGFTDNDYQLILGLLTEKGLPYSIIFTKVDKLRKVLLVREAIAEFEDVMAQNGVHILPDYLFCSSIADKKRQLKRQGITEIRYDILKGCGLPTKLKLRKTLRKA